MQTDHSWIHSSRVSEFLPERHGEPDSHHHVGDPAVLRVENSQEVAPNLHGVRTNQDTLLYLYRKHQ